MAVRPSVKLHETLYPQNTRPGAAATELLVLISREMARFRFPSHPQ